MHDQSIFNKIKTIRSCFEWIGYHFVNCKTQINLFIFFLLILWKNEWKIYLDRPVVWETHKYVHRCFSSEEYNNQNQNRTSSISDHERNAVLSYESGSLVCVQL